MVTPCMVLHSSHIQSHVRHWPQRHRHCRSRCHWFECPNRRSLSHVYNELSTDKWLDDWVQHHSTRIITQPPIVITSVSPIKGLHCSRACTYTSCLYLLLTYTHPPTRKRYCNSMFTPLQYQLKPNWLGGWVSVSTKTFVTIKIILKFWNPAGEG